MLACGLLVRNSALNTREKHTRLKQQKREWRKRWRYQSDSATPPDQHADTAGEHAEQGSHRKSGWSKDHHGVLEKRRQQQHSPSSSVVVVTGTVDVFSITDAEDIVAEVSKTWSASPLAWTPPLAGVWLMLVLAESSGVGMTRSHWHCCAARSWPKRGSTLQAAHRGTAQQTSWSILNRWPPDSSVVARKLQGAHEQSNPSA